MSAATSVTEAQQSPEDDLSDSSAPSKVNWPVFWGALIILVAFVLFASIWPSTAEDAIFGAMGWVSENFGWYYVLTAAIVVVFVLIVALTRSGHTRLGPDHARPKYNMFTWAAMLFAAGIGVDLMFFGISGPATNYLTPRMSLPNLKRPLGWPRSGPSSTTASPAGPCTHFWVWLSACLPTATTCR